MRVLLIVSILFFTAAFSEPEVHPGSVTSTSDYLKDIKEALTKQWPGNRTINLVFHGHSVPAGYFKTPQVNTFDSYPFQVLRKLKEKYPYAVINVINTSIGGETSVSGQKRFEKEVLTHKPDVLFIDYALNDRRVGLNESRKAWEKMIKRAKRDGIKVILLTPSPDMGVDISIPDNELDKHAKQIRELSEKYDIGLADSYSRFRQLNADCNCLGDYMSQINHPNEKGHWVIASELIKYF
ncbi:MAG TPA: GDSL-type esterase/lipase family protein [Chitinophagaceae bacterium]|nr:GDSL-type esterase/lipase family protein [Chitinophagaceae bacterium]